MLVETASRDGEMLVDTKNKPSRASVWARLIDMLKEIL